MSAEVVAEPRESALVAAQIGRPPRTPWRVVARCAYGYPSVIASPARLDDGTPFPNLYWLTCPWVAEAAAREESAGAVRRWALRAQSDEALAEALRAADAAVRVLRREESGGTDSCETVGVAGQRDPLGVKCLHAHAALALAGVHDPIGRSVVDECGAACPDERCAELVSEEGGA